MALYSVGEKKVSIDARTDIRLPILAIDRDQIKRVIINLMDNAIAAVGDNGTVSIETTFYEEKRKACRHQCNQIMAPAYPRMINSASLSRIFPPRRAAPASDLR